MPMLQIKYSARIEGVSPEIAIAQVIAYTVWLAMGFKGNCRITSGTDDAPGRLPHSKHKIGMAFDLGIWRVGDRIEELAKRLRICLGREFDVVVEKDHLHIEMDPPKKRTKKRKGKSWKKVKK